MAAKNTSSIEDPDAPPTEFTVDKDCRAGYSNANCYSGISSSSCPAVLQTVGGSRYGGNRRFSDFRRNLNRFCHSYTHTSTNNANVVSNRVSQVLSSQGNSSVSSSRPSDLEESEQDISVYQNRSFCTNFRQGTVNRYNRTAIKFRDSKFIFIVQILLSSLPISAIVMGSLYAQKCPGSPLLPSFGAALGILGLIFTSLWIIASWFKRRGTSFSDRQELAFATFCILILILTGIETCLLGVMSPSFEPSASNYCDESYYHYALYKDFATAGLVILTAMLYLPEIRRCLCCRNCSSTPDGYFSI